MSYKPLLICLKCSLLYIFLLFLQPVAAQSFPAGFDEAVQANRSLLGNNAVVLLWKDDTLIYKKELGDFNSKTPAPVASCSKWLTAALVMQFVDEGKLSLDDKVAKYLPIFESYNKNYITIRHCLSHYTGIRDETTLSRIFGSRRYKTLEEEVNAFAAREIRVNAGEDFSYGNIGLNIAGRVLEVISKKKFDALIRQKLLTPLGMRKTSFSVADLNAAVNPSGGAVSTADDYMNFLVMLLQKGSFRGQRILSESSVNVLMQITSRPEQVHYQPKAAAGFSYTLGSWAVEQQNGKATALACPGLFGTWPMIDFCRGYAYLVFTKTLLGEEKADAHLALKKIIDRSYSSTCK